MSIKQLAYESPHCLVCGAPLEHQATGRPRRFCSNACRQKDYREIRKWASRSVDAALAGLPDPPMIWRYETGQAGYRQELKELFG